MPTDDYQRLLGMRLRAVRAQRGLSLHAVERLSAGRWKAVVVGSYERGDRAVTVQKLAVLAEFYGVPLRELIPEPRTPLSREQGGTATLVLDVDRLARIDPQRAGPLGRYAAVLARSSGHRPGESLPLGSEELRSLATIYETSPGELAERLHQWGVVRHASSHRCEPSRGLTVAPAPREPAPLPNGANRAYPRSDIPRPR